MLFQIEIVFVNTWLYSEQHTAHTVYAAYSIYTTESLRCLMFLKGVSNVHQGCNYFTKYSKTVIIIILNNYFVF